MASIDYGAIAFKNGKLISTDHFTPMVDMVDWEDTEKDVYTYYNISGSIDLPLKLNGNCFAYIGDADYTIGFYKTSIVRVEKYDDNKFFRWYENFGNTSAFYKWTKWDTYFGREGHRVKVTKRNGYYVCKWRYKGDKYKVYFGYGVDLPYYKKWRMVNYYRSPRFLVREVKRWIKDMIDDLKWKYGW